MSCSSSCQKRVAGSPRGRRIDAARSLESRTTVLWIARLLAIAAVFLVAPRLRDDRTIGVSFLCVFFLTAPTFYYYQMLVVPFMLFIPEEGQPRLALGAGGFFAWCILGYWFAEMYPLGMPLSRLLSWSLVALSILILSLTYTRGSFGDTSSLSDAREEA